jgi:adenine deaminase
MEIKSNFVDVINDRIFSAIVKVENGIIIDISETNEIFSNYILPPFIDSHIHIESSMLVPSEFSRFASINGTVATISDPHEIANVLGIEGIRYFINNSQSVPFKFYFGVPSSVPATNFETSGAKINADDIKTLFENDKLYYLSEMMNFPGVIYDSPEVLEKIQIAKENGKVIDGHCPNLRGKDLQKYVKAGISTDHECTTVEEAIEKIKLGMKIQIRNGSSAKDFDNLFPLLNQYPNDVMFASDDIHPEDLLKGHINLLIKSAINKGANLMNVLKAASINPINHYKLDVGMLRKGDWADFVIVDNLKDLNVLQTYCNGKLIAENGKSLINAIEPNIINNFKAKPIDIKKLTVEINNKTQKSVKVNTIGVTSGKITTQKLECDLTVRNGIIYADEENDILKLIVLNRYEDNANPAIAFVKGFGLKNTAIATSIAHDSHNIIAVGSDDEKLHKAINELIKNKGGIAVVTQDATDCLALPIAGIVSNKDAYYVAEKHKKLETLAKQNGTKLESPFMTLSFLALLVIPELKLSDKGLFNSKEFRFEELIIN